jgi:hypothetical protein
VEVTGPGVTKVFVRNLREGAEKVVKDLELDTWCSG